MDYTTLVADKDTAGSIRQWINWAEIPSEILLPEAEAEIYSRLRVREMRGVHDGTIDDDAETLEMPADFIAPIIFRRRGERAGRIKIVDEFYFDQKRCEDSDGAILAGTPMWSMIVGDPAVAHFDMKTDTEIPYRLVYFKRPAALSDTNETNWLTVRYPSLLRTACLYRAWRFKKDWSSAEKEYALMEAAILQANSEFDLGEQANRTDMYSDD